MNEMVERVAEALWTARGNAHDNWPADGPLAKQAPWVQRIVREEARAAIEAVREPTDAMLDAAEYEESDLTREGHAQIHRAMIDAALKEPAGA